MQVSLLKSKIHRASITSVKPDYSGSLSIDLDLMEAAGFLHHEKILVGNITKLYKITKLRINDSIKKLIF